MGQRPVSPSPANPVGVRRSRRARLFALAFALMLVVTVWVLLSWTLVGMGVVRSGPASPGDAEASVIEVADSGGAGGEAVDTARGDDGRTAVAARRERDEARARILEALARSRPAVAPVSATNEEPTEPGPAGAGGLRDRIGGRDALVKALQDDFMPLADECIEAARERDPSLAGMLAISLELLADEEHGAIVESVGFPERNEVHDALLHECIRETSLSTILPPPPEGGREAFELTLPIDPPTAP